MSKTYRLYCEICNWNKISKGDAVDVFEIKSASIPGGAPKLDPDTNKVVIPKNRNQTKKFRCPKCGRGVRAKVISDPQEELNEKLEKQRKLEDDKKNFTNGLEGSTKGPEIQGQPAIGSAT